MNRFHDRTEFAVVGRTDPDPEAPRGPWDHDPGRPTDRDLVRYADWRMTKCEPRDYADARARVEDIDQATHELVGEVAELGMLVGEELIDCMLHDGVRARIADEAGDVFFCASWAGDAWGCNPLRAAREGGAGVDGFLSLADDARLRARYESTVLGGQDVLSAIFEINEAFLATSHEVLVRAGLLCNMFKKLAWQGRPQHAGRAGECIERVLEGTARLLAITGQDVGQALARNVEKLDARYPRGYDPAGPRGGIRTGKGG